MKPLLSILIYCLSLAGSAQTSEQINELKKLGRDSLIKLAVKKLNEPGFDPAAYDRIIVKADSSQLIVEFGLSIQFIAPKACYYNNIYVALVGAGSGKSITGDCNEPKFYKLSEAQKKKIDFVFECINKDNDIGNIPNKKMNEGAKMEIMEKAGYYYIEVSDNYTFSHYKIAKGSGNISEAAHKHYYHDWNGEPKFEIIK